MVPILAAWSRRVLPQRRLCRRRRRRAQRRSSKTHLEPGNRTAYLTRPTRWPRHSGGETALPSPPREQTNRFLLIGAGRVRLLQAIASPYPLSHSAARLAARCHDFTGHYPRAITSIHSSRIPPTLYPNSQTEYSTARRVGSQGGAQGGGQHRRQSILPLRGWPNVLSANPGHLDGVDHLSDPVRVAMVPARAIRGRESTTSHRDRGGVGGGRCQVAIFRRGVAAWYCLSSAADAQRRGYSRVRTRRHPPGVPDVQFGLSIGPGTDRRDYPLRCASAALWKPLNDEAESRTSHHRPRFHVPPGTRATSRLLGCPSRWEASVRSAGCQCRMTPRLPAPEPLLYKPSLVP